MLNGGYVMLDVTPYQDGETYTDLYAKLLNIKAMNKPLIIVDNNFDNNNNLCIPINAALLYDGGWFGIGYVVFDTVIQIEIESDGSLTKTMKAITFSE